MDCNAVKITVKRSVRGAANRAVRQPIHSPLNQACLGCGGMQLRDDVPPRPRTDKHSKVSFADVTKCMYRKEIAII